MERCCGKETINMFRSLFRACSLVIVMSAAGFVYAQKKPPESILDQFVAAWNNHDMKAMDKLYTDDAIWVTLAEVRLVGRPDIIKDMTAAHTTWAGNVSLAKSDVETRMISPSSAVIFFKAGFIVDGQPIPDSKRALMIVVVKRSNQWKIAAGQLDHPTPKPPA